MRSVAFTVTVTGKGGTGKSTVTALLLMALKELVKGPILVVDADPNSNLNEVIGVDIVRTVGDLREGLQSELDKLPSFTSREEHLEYLVRGSLTECEGFDFLAMGRPEGPGCYCYINHLLRRVLALLSKDYELVLIDAEAGLEHLSRRTTQDVDVMMAVTDITMRGVHTIKRILELINEIEIKVKEVYAVVNRVRKLEEFHRVRSSLENLGIRVAGHIPEDPLVAQYDLEGLPFFKLPDDSQAVRSARSIAEVVVKRMQARQVRAPSGL